MYEFLLGMFIGIMLIMVYVVKRIDFLKEKYIIERKENIDSRNKCNDFSLAVEYSQDRIKECEGAIKVLEEFEKDWKI